MRIARDPAIHADAVKYQYEKEHLLLIGDWYHRPAEDVLKWFKSLEANGQEVRFYPFCQCTPRNC